MGFYANIRSDISLVKQVVDMIFTSKRHTCHCEDFICIHNSEREGYWYHVYRIDVFTMKFVRCERTPKRSDDSILGYLGNLGPSYFAETDDIFEVDMLEMIDSKNREAYQEYVNNAAPYRYVNVRVIFRYYSDNSSSKKVSLEFTFNSLYRSLKFYFTPRFLPESI